MPAGKDLPQIEVTSRAQLRDWLEANCAISGSIWLVTWKKQTPNRHVPYDAIVEEALCFGWVDSLPRKLDEQRTMLLLSPRKLGSAWSAANKARVERLTASGRMTPAGLAAVEAAQADGSWVFLDDVERLGRASRSGGCLRDTSGCGGAFRRLPAIGSPRHSRMDQAGEAAGNTGQACHRDSEPRSSKQASEPVSFARWRSPRLIESRSGTRALVSSHR